MKTIRIIGDIGPESTIEYYRLIIAACREQKRHGSSPAIIINSIDLKKMLDLIGANELRSVTGYLLGEVKRAGGFFGAQLAHAGKEVNVATPLHQFIYYSASRRSKSVTSAAAE